MSDETSRTDTETPTVGAASLDAHLVVLGGGIAGMTSAAYAATRGLNVIVIEKAPDIGGSSILSGGKIWAPTDPDDFVGRDAGANHEIQRALVVGYDAAMRWIESTGVELGPPQPFDHLQGFPSSFRQLDILGYIDRCKSLVLGSGGWVITNAQVSELLTDGSAVVGIIADDHDGQTEIRCDSVVLATGGIQGDRTMRKSYIGDFAVDLPLRANPYSTGDGLRLGLSAGASIHRSRRFYGHLMPPIDREYEPRDYVPLAQTYSPRGVLLDRAGRRFTDESISYYGNAFAVSQLSVRRALLLGDNVIREYDRTSRGKVDQIDRPAEAPAHGAERVAIADTWAEIAAEAASWGYSNIEQGVTAFNRAVADGDFADGPPRREHRRPLDQPPYFAMEVRPAITFAFSGLRISRDAQVLDAEDRPIPGLLAAGVDAGAYDTTYGGGLSLGVVTGVIAAMTALSHQ